MNTDPIITEGRLFHLTEDREIATGERWIFEDDHNRALDSATAPLREEVERLKDDKQRLMLDNASWESTCDRVQSAHDSACVTIAKIGEERDELRNKVAEALRPCEHGHGLQTECYGCQRDAALAELATLRTRLEESEKTIATLEALYMLSSSSGGPIDPAGACPDNPTCETATPRSDAYKSWIRERDEKAREHQAQLWELQWACDSLRKERDTALRELTAALVEMDEARKTFETALGIVATARDAALRELGDVKPDTRRLRSLAGGQPDHS